MVPLPPRESRTVLADGLGLSVYCTVTLVRDFPCSVALFSPPGSGAAMPATVAPFVLPPLSNPLGCRQDPSDSPKSAQGLPPGRPAELGATAD
ncbi:unnamed protein product, partial [Discosporangium mesarthrocarpum]